MIRRLKIIAACLPLLCRLLHAQTPAAREGPVRNANSFVHLTTRPWFTFDPADAHDSVSFIIIGNVYEPLITFKSAKDTDSFLPFLASEVPTTANGLLSADGTVYSFPIRKDVRFHDGQMLTPEDVRYSLLRFMLRDKEGGPASLLLKPILGVYGTRGPDGKIALNFSSAEDAIRVEGDKVVIRLKEPSAYFLKVLASLPVIVCKSWTVSHGDWDGRRETWERYNNRPASDSYLDQHMNGTGPFLLADVQGKKQITFKRNDKYWRAPASLSEVFLRVVPSKALRLWMLENGDADSSFLEDQDFSEAREIPGVRVLDDLPSTASGEMFFFTFDVKDGSEFSGSGLLDGAGIPPDFFKDPEIRKGFAYALDYEGYLKRGMGLRGKRAAGPIPDSFLASKPSPLYEYSLEKAKAAFQKAYGGRLWQKGFALTLAYSRSNASRQVLAELLTASLEKINPRFNLRSMGMSSAKLYSLAEKHRLPLFIAGYYADYPDPQSFAFGLLHGSGYFPKAQKYINPKIDAMVEEAGKLMDCAQRRRLYLRIVQAAAEDLPQIYTYRPTRFVAARAWVKGLSDDQNVGNLSLNNFPYFYALSKSER